jgi:hypothetical protein
MDAGEAVRRELVKPPFGSLGDEIGGRKFPSEDGIDDSERIAALEDAVRALAATLKKLAGQVDKR